MKFAWVCFYTAMALVNLGQAIAAGLFGYAPGDSAVACAAFVGSAGAFLSFAKDAVKS